MTDVPFQIMRGNPMTAYVEKGDIYFFYRPRINDEEIKNIDDIQRFYIVLAADEQEKARLFLVGKKRMPEIIKGKSKSTAREWRMNILTGKPAVIGEALLPLEYETKTRGRQEQGEAIPVGEGRYAIFERDSSSRLAYRLSAPDKPGKAQKELGILDEEDRITGTPSLFKTLGLKKNQWPTDALESGRLTEPQMKPDARAPAGDRSK
jgi:hypothetical protein